MAARKTDSMAWVKGAERLIESALEAIDSVPMRMDTFEQWRSARMAVWRAGKGLSDLRRLAELIARNEGLHEKVNEVKDSHAGIIQQQFCAGPPSEAGQAKPRKAPGLRSHWSQARKAA